MGALFGRFGRNSRKNRRFGEKWEFWEFWEFGRISWEDSGRIFRGVRNLFRVVFQNLDLGNRLERVSDLFFP